MTKKRKLKGVNSKRIPKHKKEKMEKTLAKMDEIREKDNALLRNILEDRLKFAIAEREKGLKTIESIKQKILQLEGAIITIRGILNPPKEKED